MSFSYNNTRISASGTFPIDFVRFKIDDINSAAYDIEDEEITTVFSGTLDSLSQLERNYLTAITVAEHLAVRYRKEATFSSAGTSMNLKERAEAWLEVVNDLRMEFLQKVSVSSVLYPNRPHYNGNITIDQSGWVDYSNWR